MERDVEFCRDLLKSMVKDGTDLFQVELVQRMFPKANPTKVVEHLRLLADAGLVEAFNPGTSTKDYMIKIVRVTWNGHEFLDNTEKPERWQQTKDVAKEAGGAGMGVLIKIAAELAWKTVKTAIDNAQ